MAISKKEVLATAALARLDLSAGLDQGAADSVIDKLAVQMTDIVTYMDILNGLDTTDVDPLYSPMRMTAPPREDEATGGNKVEAVLANAPERHDTFFVVPPVL